MWYYLPLHRHQRGWTYSKNRMEDGKDHLADGRTLEVVGAGGRGGKGNAFMRQTRLCAQKETGGNRSNINNMPGTEETWNPVINPAKTTYQKLVKVFMYVDYSFHDELSDIEIMSENDYIFVAINLNTFSQLRSTDSKCPIL